VLQWISYTLKGIKVRTCLYLQSKERTGKGSILKLLSSILQKRFCKISKSESLTKYTKPLEGCQLVNVDELQDYSDKHDIMDALKVLITEDTFECRSMYSNSYQQKNNFNIIVTTNNDSVFLSQTNNKRYVVLDVSEAYIGNSDYFNKYNKIISNEEVQIQFYKYMLSIYDPSFDCDNIPTSINKKLKIIDALPRIFKYIKDVYICNKRSEIVNSKDFFDIYYKSTNDKTSKIKLSRYLKEIEIVSKDRRTKENEQIKVFDIDYKILQDLFMKKQWLDDIYNTDGYNADADVKDLHILEIEKLKLQILELEAELKKVKTEVIKPEVKTEVIKPEVKTEVKNPEVKEDIKTEIIEPEVIEDKEPEDDTIEYLTDEAEYRFEHNAKILNKSKPNKKPAPKKQPRKKKVVGFITTLEDIKNIDF